MNSIDAQNMARFPIQKTSEMDSNLKTKHSLEGIFLNSHTLRYCKALVIALSAAAGVFGQVPSPLVEILLNNGTGLSATNSGSYTGTSATGTLSSGKPSWTTNVPPNGGSSALDFGSTDGVYYVDFPGPVNGLKGLQSFTITGWVNNKSTIEGYGGNRIVSWIDNLGGNGGHGVDLVYKADGSLHMGINEWPDQPIMTSARSSGGKIPTDATAPQSNWRFFAVTYDMNLSGNNVKFYFGSPTTAASLDVAKTYLKGAVGINIGPQLTVGNFNTDTRANAPGRNFKGIIDQIRIYGSASNGSGALSLADIQVIQNVPGVTSNLGVKYEYWDGIGGVSVSNLTSNPNYPNSPTGTLFLSTFKAPVNRAENYGARMSGWLRAPATGTYTFYIASDDNSEFYLSTTASSTDKVKVAWVGGLDWTGEDQWEKTGLVNSRQSSGPIPLVEGEFYYMEALMKEGGTGDNLSIGWKTPTQNSISLIPTTAAYLSPTISDPYFPSSFSFYDQGTTNKKAMVSWKKETGNDRLAFETEGVENMSIRGNAVNIPNVLNIGPNKEFHFQWEPTNYAEGKIAFKTGSDDRPAMEIIAGTESPPEVHFPNPLFLTGDLSYYPIERDIADAQAIGNINSFDGVSLYRKFKEKASTTSPQEVEEFSTSNASSNTITRTATLDPSTVYEDSTKVNAGSLVLYRKEPESVYPPLRFYKNTTTSSEIKLEEGVDQVFDTQNKTTITSRGLITGGEVSATTITATSFVSTPTWKIPDYVFEEDYKFRSISETEAYVKTNKHLPGIPSAKEIGERGMDLTEMNVKLLKSLEELTLHVIELNKKMNLQEKQIARLKKAANFKKAIKE